LADLLVRIMPDKSNDQIISSPTEENTSLPLIVKNGRMSAYYGPTKL